jgi:rSAM/selenodomain-associated transferase 1
MFVRYPEAGRVKTRLAASLGDERAATLYRAFVEDLVERLTSSQRWRFVLAVDPAWTEETYSGWLPGIELWSQGEGDLGTRMQSVVRQGLEGAAPRVVIIGSDVPQLPLAALHEAMDTDADLVLGPSEDGGYFLIGLRKPLPLFEGVAWSTSTVLEETVSRARRANVTMHLLHPAIDMDTIEQWIGLAARLRCNEALAALAPRTARLAREWSEHA